MRKYSAPGLYLLKEASCLQEGDQSRTAVETLRSADVILFDADVDRRILQYATHIPKVYLGKRKGRSHYSPQEVSKLIVKLVRKCGKVVLLGNRTGTEAVFRESVAEHALREGIRVEAIPLSPTGAGTHQLSESSGGFL